MMSSACIIDMTLNAANILFLLSIASLSGTRHVLLEKCQKGHSEVKGPSTEVCNLASHEA